MTLLEGWEGVAATVGAMLGVLRWGSAGSGWLLKTSFACGGGLALSSPMEPPSVPWKSQQGPVRSGKHRVGGGENPLYLWLFPNFYNFCFWQNGAL